MVDDPRVVLGVSCDFHDSAAALLVDGEILAAAEEERFSRLKHDSTTPRLAMEACLRTADMEASEVEVIAFYEKPVDVLSRFLASRRRQGPAGFGSFVRDLPRLVGSNLMVGYRLEKSLRELGSTSEVQVTYAEHHRSHAAAAFFPSPFESAAVLTVDGIGEWATATISRGSGHSLDVLEELRYPDSLGLLYSFVTAFCGFRPLEDEYKLMGLAPYGSPRFLPQLEQLAETMEDGSLGVDAARLGFYSPRGLRRKDLHGLLGGPPTERGASPTERDADLAASVQRLTERSLELMVSHALELTGERSVCLAGGVALNCVANGRLLSDGLVDDLWVQPASGDAGSAVGAALSSWHEVFGRPRVARRGDAMNGAFLGPSVDSREVGHWLRDRGVEHQVVEDRRALSEMVARRLADGAVVGWFQGRMEFGPRALGHRSILADPRRAEMRDEINDRVKGREPFRPFAPAVLAERRSDWFDLPCESPYMLLVAQVHDQPPAAIPACTHVDGSARVQTVDAGTNPEFHELLSAFEDLTGCPVLLNTSFNVAGEPIVASPDHALATAERAGLDLLVIEDHVIETGRQGAPR